MKTLVITIILTFNTMISFSQRDTLILYPDHYLLNDIKYNQKSNGLKQGRWMQYGITIPNIDGNVCSGFGKKAYIIETHYKPLSEEQALESKIDLDTIDFDTIVYSNHIPPRFYYISAKGNYTNNLKEGIWQKFHRNGQVLSIINFSKGIPTENFKIFRDDGSLMIYVKPLNRNKYEILKYTSNEVEIDYSIKSLDEIKMLLE